MRKLLFIFCFLFLSLTSFCNVVDSLPLKQNLGSSSTLVEVPAFGAFRAGIAFRSFTDTTQANTTYLDDYPFMTISTTSDGNLWMRNASATAWTLLGGGSVSPSGNFWALGGNTIYSQFIPRVWAIGSLSQDSIGIMTSGVFRLKFYSTALPYMNNSDDSILVRKSDGYVGLIPKSAGGSVNIYNSDGTLTGNRTLSANSFYLSLDSLSNFQVSQKSTTGTYTGSFVMTPQDDAGNPVVEIKTYPTSSANSVFNMAANSSYYRNATGSDTASVSLNAGTLELQGTAAIKFHQLTNLSTQDQLIGQYGTTERIGYVNIGSGLSLSSGTLSATGGGVSPQYFNIMLSGQSNAWGANDATQLDTSANPRVLVWNHAQTTPAWQTFRINQRPLRTSTYNSVDGGSAHPEWAGSNNHTFYFAKKLADAMPNDTIRVIMAIGDGSAISSWFFAGVQQKYLDSIVTRGNASGISKLDLFIWDQGESNTASASGQYKMTFDSIKQVLRRQTWWTRTTPTVVVGMPQIADGADPSFQGIDTLLRWMDRGDDLWVGYARTDSCLIDNNQVHFDTTALQKIGTDRIWQAWQSLPHRFAELYPGFLTDTTAFVRYNRFSGSITESNNVWSVPTNAYMVDTVHGMTGDCLYEVDLSSTGVWVMGLDTTTTNEFYYSGAYQYDFAAFVSAGTIYAANGGDGGQTAIVGTQNIDALQIRRKDGVTKLWARVKDFYVPLFTYSISTSAALYPKLSGFNTSVVSNAKQSQTINGATIYDKLTGGTITTSERLLQSQGTDVVSANNLSLGTYGNTFSVTGTTQINLISNSGWQNGAVIRLVFASTPTVKNNQSTSGSDVKILLAGGADFSATADDVLTLVLSSVGGVQAWREVSRSVN